VQDLFETVVFAVEAVAVLLLLVGLIVSTGRYLYGIARKQGPEAYLAYRRGIGRTLLLTLEFLIAADILETVAVDRTLTSLGILGGLVIVRTFLSFALEVELNGRWPWQGREGVPAGD
jgi:uncharacterized membrane protein